VEAGRSAGAGAWGVLRVAVEFAVAVPPRVAADTRRVDGRGARRLTERVLSRFGSSGPGPVPGVRLASSPTAVILSHPDADAPPCGP
jgi:hypothetical protein